jgi:ribosomal protein L5
MLLYNYYKNIILYNLVYQHRYKNLYKFSKFYKINLKLEIKNSIIDIKKENLISAFFIIFILTNQIPYFFYSKEKKIFNNKDKEFVGCKLILRNQKLFYFLNKIIFNGILQKSFNGFFISKKFIKNLNFKLKNIENFFEIKEEFLLSENIKSMDINIMTTSKNNKDFIIFMKNFNFKKYDKTF